MFNLLSHAVMKRSPKLKRAYGTTGNMYIANQLIQLCSHEEADTRLLLHACDEVLQGHVSILILDTDVIVIATSCFDHIGVSELFTMLCVGTSLKYVPIHEIVRSLWRTKSQVLSPFLYYRYYRI